MDIETLFQTMDYGPAPESPAAANAWLDQHKRAFRHFIGNKWVEPSATTTIEVTNPATGETLGSVSDANKEDIDSAVRVAREGFKTWSQLSPHQRARHLYAIARSIQKHDRLFAVIESMDNGKPIRESRDIDVPLVARHFSYHAGWAQLMTSEMRGYKPLGVVGQIIPWNFPLLMLAWKIAPALAMGNAVVLKPAPYTPLTALLFAEIVAEAGLPPGVVNIVTGGDDAGALVVNHPDVDKIAFTGSTSVGRIIRQATAGSGKKLSLELGGKSPFMVFEDADQDSAVEGLVDAIWFNQGQVCCAGSRLLVQESIEEAFISKLRSRMSKLRTGNSLDKAIDLGAVVDPVQYKTIHRWVEQGVAEGADLYQPDVKLPEAGCFYPPTLLTNVAPASTVAQEEIFGPVLTAMSFRTPQEGIKLANNTRYGLAASVWTENINVALEVAHRVKAGSVWINSTNLFDAAAGFGGYRESGYGREGGKEGLYEYVRPVWEKYPERNAYIVPSNGTDASSWGLTVPERHAGLPSRTEGERAIDRTAKMYIGGRQKRPDGHYSRSINTKKGKFVGLVGEGNRKDIRDAVEAAHAARGWADRTPYNRAQILYYVAENLAARGEEFAQRIHLLTGKSKKSSSREVEKSLDRLFTYAAWADKFGGTVQETPLQGIVVAHYDYLGVIGIACPLEYPLLGMISLIAPAIARGNTVVVIPSEIFPLVATDFYQVLDTSDVPGGVVNIVTGNRDHLAKTLVEHEDVDAMWYFGDKAGSREVERRSIANMKRTWVDYGKTRDWEDDEQGSGDAFLKASIQIKNIWVPSGLG